MQFPTLEQFAEQTRDLDREAFLARHLTPFLLVRSLGSVVETPGYETFHDGGLTDGSDYRASWKHTLTVPLAKSGRNTFAQMVTVGRASNNDIVLNDPAISKFHAYFGIDPTSDAVSVRDAGSTYGTLIEGARVSDREPAPVGDGDIIVFADKIRATFVTAATLWERLRMETDDGG